ncbi:HlyD family efflux transporter periplasmic adaptor subunit [Rhodocyclus tenuis]|uniref:HlyD family efflux transporter periplasmic adaptor subunit n=1 Tax=Rhodocyclus tenuis TaxID=1066 RepID=A0A6L5K0A0_RHOTE|nr:HlyD family efflux transporter periplasmic adaptor subunit [Rhodocyclus gracilis]MQY52542.1 HlyD family efflux transporter periplasmic adaptor subunit [Rhodocyclus gracilis]MRD73987.1 HlyD family efflux transporter periplasmic adaptor subunit [Rhodocyclus gracilis]
MSDAIDTTQASAGNPRRRQLLSAAAAVIVLAAVAYGLWWALVSRFHEHTDNAYVGGNLVQVTPQISGTVLAIKADDTDYVEAGQPLVMLDPADARLALAEAEADLAHEVRQVRNLYASRDAAAAQVSLRAAEQQRASDDLKRRQSVADSGALATEDIDHAVAAAHSADAALAAAREQLAAAEALTEGTTPEQHPRVEKAAARVREAHLAYTRAMLPAPVTGYVAKRSVQVGQRIQPGAPLMAIVPLNGLWVDANFKESQLSRMRIGQPVKLFADIYGHSVEYHGKVVGLGAGTGGVFSLLPAQNATGNWIKVVQRLPVRIALDATELAEHPLRVGLSVEAEVDVDDASGPVLGTAPRTETAYETRAFGGEDKEADERIARIIGANLGKAKR